MTEPDTAAPFRRLSLLLALLLALIILSASWAWGPLKDWLDVKYLLVQLRQLGQTMGPFEATGVVALASILAVPIGVIIPVVVLAFAPVQAFVCMVCGATLGGAISFAVGAHLGREGVQRLAGARITRISQRLAARGVLSVFIIRLLPIAPFAIVNMVAGTSHIRFRDFVLGTFLGLMPGTLLAILLIDRLLVQFLGG